MSWTFAIERYKIQILVRKKNLEILLGPTNTPLLKTNVKLVYICMCVWERDRIQKVTLIC